MPCLDLSMDDRNRDWAEELELSNESVDDGSSGGERSP